MPGFVPRKISVPADETLFSCGRSVVYLRMQVRKRAEEGMTAGAGSPFSVCFVLHRHRNPEGGMPEIRGNAYAGMKRKRGKRLSVVQK